ncbi:MAG: histidine phosphatase family protein [Pseudobdellovibrionaceae bacterium]
MSEYRQILLMRHGEADEKKPDQSRCLTREGMRQINTVTFQLISRGLIPDYVVCSSVVRTQQTLAEIRNLVPVAPAKISFCGERLYKARSAEDVLEILGDFLPEDSRCPLIIGHNPGMFLTASYLASHHPTASGTSVSQTYPTSTLSVIRHNGASWQNIAPSTCVITDVLSGSPLPKMTGVLSPLRS